MSAMTLIQWVLGLLAIGVGLLVLMSMKGIRRYTRMRGMVRDDKPVRR